MTLSGDDTHVFIVRIWREPRELPGAQPVWRGSIEHLPTNARRYFVDLDDIVDFIAPYLETMGVRSAGRRWGRGCLTWLRRLRKGRR